MPGSTDVFRGRDIIRSGIKSLLAGSTSSSDSGTLTSSTFISEGYRKALAYLTVSDTGSTASATTLQFVPQFATDTTPTNWFDYREGVWASMVFSAAQLQTSTFRRAHTLPLDGRRLRFSVERSTTIEVNFVASISVEGID